MRRKPSGTDWLVMGGAMLWLIAFFLPWYHTIAPGLSLPLGGNVAGGFRWVLFVLAVGVIGFAAVVSFGLVEVNLAVSSGLILMIAGAVLSVATLVYAIWAPTESSFSYGVWLSLLGGLAVTYGGFASHNAEAGAGPLVTSRPDKRWTPQPPATDEHEGAGPDGSPRGAQFAQHQVPSHPPHTQPPSQSPQVPSAPPTAPPSQPAAPGFPQQPIPPGYPHGHSHSRGYGGGQGEGW